MATADIRGTWINYTMSGPDGAPAVVLLHELGGSVASWQGVIERLEARMRVVAYDQRGAGGSQQVREPFTFDDHLNDLTGLLDVLDLTAPLHVVGVASGAALALMLAATRPDRVASLVLCSPAVDVSAERRDYLQERSDLAVRDGMAAVVDATLARSYPAVVIEDRAAFERYRAGFLDNDPRCYGWANMAFADSNVGRHVAAVRCPSLVLAGKHDLLRPPDDVRALADRLAGSRYEILDAGHLMSVQAPAALASRIMEFVCESH
jgi:3-oxoadipate enol-lactonase